MIVTHTAVLSTRAKHSPCVVAHQSTSTVACSGRKVRTSRDWSMGMLPGRDATNSRLRSDSAAKRYGMAYRVTSTSPRKFCYKYRGVFFHEVLLLNQCSAYSSPNQMATTETCIMLGPQLSFPRSKLSHSPGPPGRSVYRIYTLCSDDEEVLDAVPNCMLFIP